MEQGEQSGDMLSGESRMEISIENAVRSITAECGVTMWGTGKKMVEEAFDVQNTHSEYGNRARITENRDDAVSTAGDVVSTAEVQKMGTEHGERRKQGRAWEMQSEGFRNMEYEERTWGEHMTSTRRTRKMAHMVFNGG